MRAPVYTPAVVPVEAYRARFVAPTGPTLAGAIGRALVTGGAELGNRTVLYGTIAGLADDTAGRAAALRDAATIEDVVGSHAALPGAAGVAGQPAALNDLAGIVEQGRQALGSPGMVAAYDAGIGPVVDDAAARITGHALNQAMVERSVLDDQAMQAAQRQAGIAWLEPGRFAAGLSAVGDLAASQVGPMASEEERAQTARQAVGGAVAHAVGGALMAGEPEIAAHLLDGWGGTLTPAAYQLAYAQVGQAARDAQMQAVFNQAAAGSGAASSADAPAAGGLAVAAMPGGAVYPIAGGVVAANGGAADNGAVTVVHPDGSSARYGGLGLAAVAPGDMVTASHVIGSAGPALNLRATTIDGGEADAGALLRSAGGPAAMVGGTDVPRVWDMPEMVSRIAGRDDLSEADRALAMGVAQQRMAADAAQLAAADRAGGRQAIGLLAGAPRTIRSVADLPPEVASSLLPANLAAVDGALRAMAVTPVAPAADGPAALRLELMQRQDPGGFAAINLAPLAGTMDLGDLARLAGAQDAIESGRSLPGGGDLRSGVLDALARHEFATGGAIPDATLPAVCGRATTWAGLNRIDPADGAAMDGAVASAIQRLSDQP